MYEKTHIVNVHPELVFTDRSVSLEPSKIFEWCCVKLLTEESKGVKLAKLNDKIVYRCKYCPLSSGDYTHVQLKLPSCYNGL